MNEEIKNGAAPALEDENEIIAVRRRKLAEAQAEGRDPFAVTKYDVTAHAGEIKDNFEQFDQKEVSARNALTNTANGISAISSGWKALYSRPAAGK